MARKGRFPEGELTEEDKKRKLGKENFRKTFKIFAYSLPYKWPFLLGLVFLILSTLTTMAFPMLAGKIANVAVGETDKIFKTINQVALVFVAFIIIQAFASFFRVYLFAIVTEKTMSDIRTALYSKIISLPIKFFEKNRVGDLISRINTDVAQLESMLSIGLAEIFRQVVTLIIGVGIIFYTSPKLALVMISTFPFMMIVGIVFGKFIRKLSKKVQGNLAEANIVVEETLMGINVVKAFANELFEINRYRRGLDKVVANALKASLYRGFFISFIIMGLFGGIALVFWYGAGLVQSKELGIGDLLTFILYTVFVGASAGGMSDLFAQLQKTFGASERILEILEEESEILIADTHKNIKIKGDISYNDVNFSYPTRTDVEVLKGITLDIEAGKKIALVGYSGAGKSTIAQLLMKFYTNLEHGSITIDGKPLSEINTQGLRSQMAIVPQEVILFGGSIKENIAYGKPKATDDEIRKAAQKANALEFIDQFPEKMDTVVGDRGIKLSGGQRQRIAIARAILRDPSILILDEATSSLDASSENLVQTALDELMKNRTTLIIAHRLATIRNVDQIYVLSEGKIAERGTHDELLKKEEGIYHNLVKLQMEKSAI